MINSYSVTLCIPILNPGALARQMINALKQQSMQPDEILVIDSASTDGSIGVYDEIGAKIISIKRADFNHGGTRNIAFEKSYADVYVFMTQDAIPVDRDALKNVVKELVDNSSCGLVYGRQVSASSAGVFARHARLFNYPPGDQLVLKRLEDVPRLGFKTAFCSNSFAAYRREAMAQIGFFPVDTLFAEDSIAAARLLQLGWEIAYAPQAVVEHSHDYTLWQEFCRYFDVGAFHSMNRWYMDLLGGAEGEGVRFVRSEYNYLTKEMVRFALFKVLLRNGVRWSGYRLGKLNSFLPKVVNRHISANKAYWK